MLFNQYIKDQQYVVMAYQWGITLLLILMLKMLKLTSWKSLLILELVNLRNMLPMYFEYTQKLVRGSLYDKYDLFLNQFMVSYYCFLITSFLDVPEKAKIVITVIRYVMWNAMLIIYPATDQESV